MLRQLCQNLQLLYLDLHVFLHCSDFNGRCVPGMRYSECSSACEPTCDSYLSNENIACPAVCVQGCVCPVGLIQYRDHCVSPLECTSLLNSKLIMMQYMKTYAL